MSNTTARTLAVAPALNRMRRGSTWARSGHALILLPDMSPLSASVVPGVVGPVRRTLLEEGVASLLGFVGHVGEPGRLPEEDLLADEPVVDEVERVLEHPLRGGALGVDLRAPLQRHGLELGVW